MEPFYQDNHRTLYNGDCRVMPELADESVQMVVTSPPFWGLRKYAGNQDLIWGGDKDCQHKWGTQSLDTRHDHTWATSSPVENRPQTQYVEVVKGQYCTLCGAWRGAYGLEPAPELYVQHTIEILREIKRVLRPDGVVFWNIGDSYAGSPSGHQSWDNWQTGGKKDASWNYEKRSTVVSGLKPKDLCLIPFRVAIAAQEDGWYIRSVIIWNKPNPMPESVRDRPTESHEYILMLTKSARYYWDAEAVRESPKPEYAGQSVSLAPKREGTLRKDGGNSFLLDGLKGRNLRSVWTFPTQPYPGAHFATFPKALPERCIKATTPEVGCCAECGKPWVRIVDKQKSTPRSVVSPHASPLGQRTHGSLSHERYDEPAQIKTIGWKPSCKCNTDKPSVPAVVLDPFAGSGTTLKVAAELNRRAVGYELSGEYCQLAVTRNKQQVLV